MSFRPQLIYRDLQKAEFSESACSRGVCIGGSHTYVGPPAIIPASNSGERVRRSAGRNTARGHMQQAFATTDYCSAPASQPRNMGSSMARGITAHAPSNMMICDDLRMHDSKVAASGS